MIFLLIRACVVHFLDIDLEPIRSQVSNPILAAAAGSIFVDGDPPILLL